MAEIREFRGWDEEICDFRGWDELIPDALGIIFDHLSPEEVLTVLPRVCKSWYKVVAGPYCWQEIDIEEWSHQFPEHVDDLLRILIARSDGSLRKLAVSGLANDEIFSFIAQHAKSLQTLRIIRSEISDTVVEQVSSKLSRLTFLDISYCNKIGSCALQSIGENCKLLTSLRRNMHPIDVAEMTSHDDEAHAIATTMPKLKYLEMAYLLITTSSVLEILEKCRDLELLDIRGCWNVHLDEKYIEEKYNNLKVLGPIVEDSYADIDWTGCSDFSEDTDIQEWDHDYDSDDDELWDEYGPLDEMHVRVFEGYDVGDNVWYDEYV